jgi:putative membrane protein
MYRKLLLALVALVFVWSAVDPYDYFTWFLEVLPAILALVVLVVTYPKFKFTSLVYTLILVHCIILMVGGHYTYAEVPLFDYLRDWLGSARNNYDKVGHFAQGFVPAMVAREILIRQEVLQKRSWLNFLVVSICMAISAAYELLEWLVAELSGESAESFLGTQGYVWDTQSDILYATIGAISALVLLSKRHNRAVEKLDAAKVRPFAKA